jgi:hypothetical protein
MRASISTREAVMSSEILLATKHLFSEDPEGIVRELWHQAEAEEGVTLSLILYPEGWTQPDQPPDRLTFSKGSILLREDGIDREVSFERAVSRVATAQLLMRRAAGFALAIQRLMQERGLSEPEAVRACSYWEHGHCRPDEDIPAQEKSRIETWAEDHWRFYLWGREVLQAIQDQDVLSRAIQAPSGVSAWILKPPDELGIQWPSAPQKDSLPFQTSLEEWLAVPPLEIVRALAEAAQRKRRVTLILTVVGNPVAGLDFHQDGRVTGFYDAGGHWKSDSWKENEAGIADFLAEEKLILRRAVVRAATFRHLVEGHGLKEAARLIALAEYGFAWLYDVPEAGRFLIRDATDRHLKILRDGMCVLEAWGSPIS